MKSSDGKSQREEKSRREKIREEKESEEKETKERRLEKRKSQKREDQRRERVRSKKMQVREKVGKSRNTVFFQWFVAPEGRKVGSLKQWVRSHRRCGAKHISKSKSTKHTSVGPLLAVEMSKKCTPLWRKSTFPSQNVQNTPASDHF